MMILVTYDINTQDKEGRSRLRKVAKVCVNYGQRVQNSVFECVVNASEYLILKNKLIKIVSRDKDSLRFYELGNNYKKAIEHYGAKEVKFIEDTLIL